MQLLEKEHILSLANIYLSNSYLIYFYVSILYYLENFFPAVYLKKRIKSHNEAKGHKSNKSFYKINLSLTMQINENRKKMYQILRTSLYIYTANGSFIL